MVLGFLGRLNINSGNSINPENHQDNPQTNNIVGNSGHNTTVDQDGDHKEQQAQAAIQRNYIGNLEKLTIDIKTLSDNRISQELERLKTEIYETDLINRLNQGQLTEHEQDRAQAIFDRMVILGITKTERQLAAFQPELERVIAEQQARIKRARMILADQ